ncbi:hypothetical protein U9M48_004560 [Paspalum notatum var. saurae]|uniref:Importin alpha-2 subunit n=1 Tax=Paspalum notatum var. saurae TaxID=547442 RepID=A0AAQ3PMX5_PASNO
MAARAAIDGGVIYLDDGAGSNNYLGDGGDDFYLGGLLEAAWCLTNIAAGEPEETKSLLPALPLLIAHLGEKSPTLVAEQCGWAIGNVAGEGAELRSTLLAQGALWPLARLMLSNKGSAARTAAWALSNLIKQALLKKTLTRHEDTVPMMIKFDRCRCHALAVPSTTGSRRSLQTPEQRRSTTSAQACSNRWGGLQPAPHVAEPPGGRWLSAELAAWP